MNSGQLPKTVLLLGDPIAGEGTAAASITPGMLVSVDGDGVAPASAGAAIARFARENEVIGKGIDSDYSTGDRVLYYHARSGDHFYAWLAQGEDIATGALLSAGANGTLVAADEGDGAASPVEFPSLVLCMAMEDVDNAPGEGPVRIKVEVV